MNQLLHIIFTFIALVFSNGCFARSFANSSRDDGRIVGGKETTIEEHPYQVSLWSAGKHICGASLIKPNIVLTAAHCIIGLESYPQHFTIRAGSNFSYKGGTVANVISICAHSNFDDKTTDYDVAVLILDKHLTLSSTIQTIELQLGGEISRGTMATVTGWGRTYEEGLPANILQEVEVPRISDESCKQIYNEFTNRMMCFGYDEGSKDACQGDSGGPIVTNGKQVGIVSWGSGCARPNTPGVYTKLSNKDISDHINKCIINI